MQTLGQIVLQDAALKHADAKRPITAWLASVSAAQWRNLVDLKADMPSADYVPPFTVFNVKGNTYRLISVVDYSEKVVVVRDLLTHADYDKGNWK